MKTLLKYGITTIIGLAFAALIIFGGDVLNQESTKDVIELVVNGFFVPGVVIFGIGLLVVASNGGTFDMINFGVKKFFGYFKREDKQVKQTFYEYRKLKLENQKSYGFFLTVGIFLTLISLVFLYFYYQH